MAKAEVASLAFIIREVGAAGGIIVSPLGLQSGAKKVAAENSISECRLQSESTTDEYVLEIPHNIFLGTVERVGPPREELEITLTRASDGAVNSRRKR